MDEVWIGDLEANGLLDTATQVWCGVFKNIHTLEIKKFYPVPFEGGDPYYLHNMIEFMKTAPTIVMHNGLQYDFPLLEKLYGFKYEGEKLDTIVWSRMLQPKRATPYMCPVKNRPHSILAWGYRVGLGKPDHDDWSQFSMDMLHRCTQDVEIGYLVYNELLEEMQGNEWESASWLNHRLFDILGKQERYGFLVDKEQMSKIIRMATTWIERIDKVLASRLPLVCDIKEAKIKGIYKWVKEPFLKSGLYKSNILKWCEESGWNPEERPIGGPFTRLSYRPLDPSSRLEVISFLLSDGWRPKTWNVNDQGERTSPKFTKDDPFEGVSGRGGQLLAKRVQVRHRRSSVEGLLKLVRDDGRIASRVTNLAETGRATHGGVVNLPNSEAFLGKMMRKIFIVPDDKVLIGTDADSCQARMLASRVNSDAYTRTILEGTKADKTTIHFLNQQALLEEGYDVPYGMCKNLQYGFLFGASDTKLGSMVGGAKEDGARVRTALLKASPGLEDVINSLTKEWESHASKRMNDWGKSEYYNGWIKGLDGRPIFIDSPHKILVYILQSDEAIMMSTAVVFLFDWLTSEGIEWGRDWAYVTFMHDETQIECRPELAERISFLAEQAIYESGKYYKLSVAQKGEAIVGRNWCETH